MAISQHNGVLFLSVGVGPDSPRRPDRNPYLGSLRAHAPINGLRMRGDVPGLVRKKEHDGIGDFVRLTDPTHRDKRGVAMRVASGPFGQERRLHRAGADRVHSDARLTRSSAACHGHARDRVLRGHIEGPTGVAV